jgi:hypothetical protein
MMKKQLVCHRSEIGTFADESLSIPNFAWHNSSYVRLPLAEAQNRHPFGGFPSSYASVRPVVRRGVTGSVSTEPCAGSRLMLRRCAAQDRLNLAVLRDHHAKRSEILADSFVFCSGGDAHQPWKTELGNKKVH